jgi:hypothetical protein
MIKEISLIALVALITGVLFLGTSLAPAQGFREWLLNSQQEIPHGEVNNVQHGEVGNVQHGEKCLRCLPYIELLP